MTVRKSWRCFFSYIMAMVTKLHVNGTHWAIRPSLALVCEHLCAPAWPDAWSSRLSSPSTTSRQCSVMNGKVYAILIEVDTLPSALSLSGDGQGAGTHKQANGCKMPCQQYFRDVRAGPCGALSSACPGQCRVCARPFDGRSCV